MEENNTKNISYRARFKSNSLSNFVDNLAEKIYKLNVKCGYDNKRM